MEDHIDEIHAQYVWELMIAFKDNRWLERSHLTNQLDTKYKKVLLDLWKAEVIYN